MFQVGQIVKPNPKYYPDGEELNIRGVISEEKERWDCNIIYWSDGGKGNIYLHTNLNYILPA